MINLVTFDYRNARFAWSSESLKEAHSAFNAAFVNQFPKRLYTTPFTNYTDVQPWNSGGQISGIGETTWTLAQSKNAIQAMFDSLGIKGNLVISVTPMENPTDVTLTKQTTYDWATTDGADKIINDLKDDVKEIVTPTFLGFSITTVALVGLGFLFLMRR